MVEPSIITAVCTGVASTRTITAVLNRALSAATFFQINISGFTNPSSTLTTSTFEFYTYSSANVLLDYKNTNIFMTATAGSLTAASMTPLDSTVAAMTTITFSLTVNHKVSKGGQIQVTMPKWNPNNPTTSEIYPMIQGSYTCAVVSNLESTISCTFSTSTDTLTVSNSFDTADIAAGTVLSFTCSGFKNPISTAIKTGFTIITVAGDGGRVDSLATTLQVSNPATISSATLSYLDTQVVQTLAVFQLTFPSPVPLDAGCIIDIQFPSDLPITTTDLTSVSGVGLFGPSRVMTTTVNVSTRTVTITDGCTSYVSPAFNAIVTFTKISNPLSIKPTDSLSILIRDSSSNSIATRSTGIQYVAAAGSMTSATLAVAATTVSGTTTANISIQPAHKITTAGALKITFPTEVTFTSTSCSLTSPVAIQPTATCSVSGQVVRIASPFSADYIPGSSSTISFTLSSLVMPPSTAPTGSFSFESVLVSSSVDYTIDKSSYSNMVTATTGTIASATVTPSTLVAYTKATYTIKFVNAHAILQGGYIVVTFPSEVPINSPAATANSIASIGNIASTLVCAATSTTLTITSGYPLSSLAAGSEVSFSVGQIDNPIYANHPTSSFQISTFSSTGYSIDTINSGVTVTMTSVNSFKSLAIAPESLVNGAVTNLEVTVAASSPVKDGDVLIVTFPSQVKAPSGTIT